MPVTHSPGNPFAFTPVKSRGPTIYHELPSDETPYQQYASPAGPHKSINSKSAEVQYLEYQLKEYREETAKDKILKDARIEDLERRILDESQRYEKTESDKRFLFDLQAKQTKEIDDLKLELSKLRTQHEASTRDLSRSNSRLTEQIFSADELHKSENKALMREVQNLENDLANNRRAMDTLKTDLTSKNDLILKKNSQIAELEEQNRQQAANSLLGSTENLAFVTKEMSEALSKVTSLEIANASQLAKIHSLEEKSVHHAVVLEEKRSMEQKIQLMEEMRQALAVANFQISDLEKEKLIWNDAVIDTDGINITDTMTQMKSAEAKLSSQLDILGQQLNDTSVANGTLRNDLRVCKKELSATQLQFASEQRMRAKIERQKAMAGKQIKFLREQLESYDLEEQLENPNFDRLKSLRIMNLENMVEEYRKELEQATSERDSDKIITGVKRGREIDSDFNEIERGEYLRKIRSLSSELEITKREDELYKKELSTLRSSLEVLSQSSAKVQGDLPASRILQHKDNPTSKYQAVRSQTLADLKLENQSLLDQLASQPGVVTVPVQSLRNAESNASKLNETISQKEKMIRRLKEVFSAKSSEFREAVYSLLGYKLDFLPNGRVRLTSMYAEQSDHSFIFDGEAGTMQLSGGGADNEAFLGSIGNLLSYWSVERRSIPGMLSALTLELLEKDGQQDVQGAGV